jgi:DNA topoisomerase-1
MRLYELIWKRTIASQMSEAKLERTQVKINIESKTPVEQNFIANGEILTFDGFLKVYLEGTDFDEEEQEGMLPTLTEGQFLDNKVITATERFTRPPYRFTEASLVKQLEELGIGRPSTYAPTISTIIQRKYVEKGTVEGRSRGYQWMTLQDNQITQKELSEQVGSDKGKLVPTDIGFIVTDFLVAHFSDIVDLNFTAKVEADFDEIAEGKEQWREMLKSFYGKFHPNVEQVNEHAERESGERILGVDSESGKTVLVRLGKFGPIAQMGLADDPDKKFASLRPDQQLHLIDFDQAMDLFKLPKALGEFEGEDVEVANGRYGPYIRWGKKFISLPSGMDPLAVDMAVANELIEAKKKADAPIFVYEDLPVQKGKGRFGPFIKWNNMFINVNKKYDFDNLSDTDIVTLIENKKQKEKDKLIMSWPEEGIRLEKARWGRFNLIKGTTKVELPKTTKAEKITLEQAQEMLASKGGKKTKSRKKTKSKK